MNNEQIKSLVAKVNTIIEDEGYMPKLKKLAITTTVAGVQNVLNDVEELAQEASYLLDKYVQDISEKCPPNVAEVVLVSELSGYLTTINELSATCNAYANGILSGEIKDYQILENKYFTVLDRFAKEPVHTLSIQCYPYGQDDQTETWGICRYNGNFQDFNYCFYASHYESEDMKGIWTTLDQMFKHLMQLRVEVDSLQKLLSVHFHNYPLSIVKEVPLNAVHNF